MANSSPAASGAGAGYGVPDGICQLAALRVKCPHPGCDGFLMGDNGSLLIVAADKARYRPGQVVACETCSRPYRVPPEVDKLEEA